MQGVAPGSRFPLLSVKIVPACKKAACRVFRLTLMQTWKEHAAKRVKSRQKVVTFEERHLKLELSKDPKRGLLEQKKGKKPLKDEKDTHEKLDRF